MICVHNPIFLVNSYKYSASHITKKYQAVFPKCFYHSCSLSLKISHALILLVLIGYAGHVSVLSFSLLKLLQWYHM
jgi:hypothetical protein